jgi:hypothetical protein
VEMYCQLQVYSAKNFDIIRKNLLIINNTINNNNLMICTPYPILCGW